MSPRDRARIVSALWWLGALALFAVTAAAAYAILVATGR